MAKPLPFTATTAPWVALGGALGSVLRFAASAAVRGMPSFAGRPWATPSVNVTGSLAIGALEGVEMLQGGSMTKVLLYASASVRLSIGAAALGFAVARG